MTDIVHDKASTDGTKPRERRGAWMSSRQIAWAACHGRRVMIKFLRSQPAHEVSGYVVGMDDFHWHIATVIPPDLREEDEIISTSLVHKGSADVINLAPRASLHTETPAVQAALAAIGGDFWEHCERTYLGRQTAPA